MVCGLQIGGLAYERWMLGDICSFREVDGFRDVGGWFEGDW